MRIVLFLACITGCISFYIDHSQIALAGAFFSGLILLCVLLAEASS